ncbi:5-hydroxytryptamine receptor 2C-like [Patiria miniata]|uniref:G-protein coupled receptors family 1 profile domain-containing protein n=1 Tax=Patiria miniata TaxID=46514 RepID=A0A913ZST9_PATMI|nr:5-hydroxytryptamine receptor 2C-like [Patiria miniata]
MEESGNFSGQTYTSGNSELSTGEKITCIGLNVILMVLIVVGNGLLLFAIIKAKELKRSSRIFLVSLTVADLFVGLVVIPVRVVPQIIGISIGSTWFLSDRFCETLYFLEIFAIGASVLAILALSIERYLAVEMPLRFRSMLTSCRAFTVVACSWLASLCTASIFVILSVVNEDRFFLVFDGSSSLCVIKGLNWLTRFMFFNFIIVFLLIPFCVTFLASIRILHIVKNHTGFQKQAPNPSDCNSACRQTSSASGAKRLPQAQRTGNGVCRGLCKRFLDNKKALVTVLIVTLSYSASSVPFVVCVLYMEFSPYSVDQFLVELAKLSLFTSCFINVIVYTIRNRAFRGSAKRLLFRLFPVRLRCNTVRRHPVRSQADNLS